MKSPNLIKSLTIIFLTLGGIAYAADRNSKGTETAKATFAGGCFWSVEAYAEIEAEEI